MKQDDFIDLMQRLSNLPVGYDDYANMRGIHAGILQYVTELEMQREVYKEQSERLQKILVEANKILSANILLDKEPIIGIVENSAKYHDLKTKVLASPKVCVKWQEGLVTGRIRPIGIDVVNVFECNGLQSTEMCYAVPVEAVA